MAWSQGALCLGKEAAVQEKVGISGTPRDQRSAVKNLEHKAQGQLLSRSKYDIRGGGVSLHGAGAPIKGAGVFPKGARYENMWHFPHRMSGRGGSLRR